MNEFTVTTSNLSNSDIAGLTGLVAVGSTMFIAIIIIVLLASVASYVISSYLLSRIFKKAGVKTSIAWIPIYNTWKILEMGDQKGFWAVLALIPPISIVSLVFNYIAMYHIGKKFGKEDWFVALAIFLPIVWVIILGFDKSQWNGGITAEAPTMAPVQPTSDVPVNTQIAEAVLPTAAEPTYPTEPVMSTPAPETYTAPEMPEATPVEPTYPASYPTMAPSETPVAPEPEMPTTPVISEAPTIPEPATIPINTDVQ